MRRKALQLNFFLSPKDGFNIYVNWIGGDEYNTFSAFGTKNGSYTSLFDLTSTWSLNDKLNLGVNAAYGMFSTGYSRQITEEDIASAEASGDAALLANLSADKGRYDKDATWFGIAGYLNYAISDAVGFGIRAEHFDDPKGLRYFGPLVVNEITATGNIALADGRFIVKPEFRFDSADKEFFEDKDGKGKKTQATIGSAFILKF